MILLNHPAGTYPFLCLFPPLGIAGCIPVDLFQVVDHAVHQPLGVDLGFAPHCEAIQADGVADVGKDRLDRAQSLGINELADRRIDLALHLFGKSVLASFGSSQEVGDLPGPVRVIGITQTLISQVTRAAGRFRTPELMDLIVALGKIVAVGV